MALTNARYVELGGKPHPRNDDDLDYTTTVQVTKCILYDIETREEWKGTKGKSLQACRRRQAAGRRASPAPNLIS